MPRYLGWGQGWALFCRERQCCITERPGDGRGGGGGGVIPSQHFQVKQVTTAEHAHRLRTVLSTDGPAALTEDHHRSTCSHTDRVRIPRPSLAEYQFCQNDIKWIHELIVNADCASRFMSHGLRFASSCLQEKKDRRLAETCKRGL